MRQNWGFTRVVSKGRMYYPEKLPGFVATIGDKSVGLVTYEIEKGQCEVVTLNSAAEGLGIGSGLLEAVRNVAISADCERLWLITTTVNSNVLSLYYNNGLRHS